MKRNLPLFGLLGLAAVLVPILSIFAARASSPRRPKSPPAAIPGCGSKCTTPAVPTPLPARGPVPVGDPVLQELVAILEQTSSPDTFVVTTVLLGKLGFAARPALPAIVRNGERLGLFRGVVGPDKAPERVVVVNEILKSVDLILGARGAAPVVPTYDSSTYDDTPLTGCRPPVTSPPLPGGTPAGPSLIAAPPLPPMVTPPAVEQLPKPPMPPGTPTRAKPAA